MKRLVRAGVLIAIAGCSSGSTTGNATGGGGSIGGPMEGGLAGALNEAGSGVLVEGGSDAEDSTNAKPLPAGSRELNGIVNLVSEAATAELDDFISKPIGLSPLYAVHDLTTSLNLFLEHYVEVYDFVYFFTDHPLPQAALAGKFQVVTRPAQFGTGHHIQMVADGYKTNGRIRGIIGIQYDGYGPLAHEILHYWANSLDPMFGFGETPTGSHWGFAGVNGQLGGFDPSALACEAPVGALPPACTPLPNGRFHYVVNWFGPQNNSANIAYAPLELYLMGLLPRSEVPAEIPVLTDAQRLDNTHDTTSGKVVVDASGVHVVSMSDIVARHGEVSPLGQGERAFRAASVLISARPVSEAILAQVATWSAVFGNRQNDPVIKSFESLTGGRATLDTKLGPRRKASDAPPEVRAPFACNVIAQDCNPTGLGCYLSADRSFCAIPRGVPRGMPCKDSTDCAAGMGCRASMGSGVCEPFCDPIDPASPLRCDKVCPNFVALATPDGGIITGRCEP